MSEIEPIWLRIISAVNRIFYFFLLLGLEIYLIIIFFFDSYDGVYSFHFEPATLFVIVPLQFLIIMACLVYKFYVQGERKIIVVGIIINIIVMGIFLPTFLNGVRFKFFQKIILEPIRTGEVIESLLFVLTFLVTILLLIEYFVGNLSTKKVSNANQISLNSKFQVDHFPSTWGKDGLTPSSQEQWSTAKKDLGILEALNRMLRGRGGP